MARSRNADREAREARERLRRFTAGQGVHEQQLRRRRRDNVLALVGFLVVVALAALTQFLYFNAGPGVIEPTPTASITPEPDVNVNVGDIPDPELAEDRTWTGTLTLNDVPLGIELEGAAAPQAVASFVNSAQENYYEGKTCHRLTDEGVKLLQCGSIDGTGASDVGYSFGPIENSPKDQVYPTGTIALARVSGNGYSQGHQFFIVLEEGTIGNDAAGGYTVFGRVTSGLDELIASVASGGIVPGGPRGDHDGVPVISTTITGLTVQ